MEFEFNRFKKVPDSVGQSDYHNITQNTSKIKIKKFKTLQSVSPVIGVIMGILFNSGLRTLDDVNSWLLYGQPSFASFSFDLRFN